MASESNIIEAFKTTSLSSGYPYLPIHIIGGRGGYFFQFFGGSDGSMLEKIMVWVGNSQIKAVKVWRTNGLIGQFGNVSGPPSQYSFQPGEHITEMSLWGNGAGSRLGAIKFKTNKNGNYFAKMTKWPLKKEYKIDVGSGICVGVMGRSGSDIDCMGLKFLKQLQSCTLVDIHYPTIGSEHANVEVISIKTLTYANNLSTPQTHEFTASEKITTKEKWSVTTGIEASVHVTVKAGIPEIAETTEGYSLKVSVQRTYPGMDNTTEKTETWRFVVTVPANSKVKAILSIGKADINIPYTGKIKMITTDESELIFDVHGTYTGVTYTDAKMEVIEV